MQHICTFQGVEEGKRSLREGRGRGGVNACGILIARGGEIVEADLNAAVGLGWQDIHQSVRVLMRK